MPGSGKKEPAALQPMLGHDVGPRFSSRPTRSARQPRMRHSDGGGTRRRASASGFPEAARNTKRPMRPKPLMPIPRRRSGGEPRNEGALEVRGRIHRLEVGLSPVRSSRPQMGVDFPPLEPI